MSTGTKLKTLYDGCSDIRAAIKEKDSTLGAGSITTLSDDIRNINNRKYIRLIVKEPITETTTDPDSGEEVENVVGYNYNVVDDRITTTYVGNNKYKNRTDIVAAILPDDITNTSADSFNNCTNLQYVNLNNITTVNSYAFYHCSSLAIDVNLPNLNSIVTGAFSGCGIRSITSLGNITSIPSPSNLYNAPFQDCSNLKTVVLPETLTSVGGRAFSGCSSITSINLPTSLQTINGYAFYNITGVPKTINLPNLTGTLGTGAFYGCGIEKILDLGSITSIGNAASQTTGVFGRNQLTEVWLPSTLTNIGNLAFGSPTGYGNFDLEFIVCKATTPPTLATNAFQNTNSTFKIYVPYSSDHSVLNSYKAATNWSAYESRIYELNQDETIPTT